MGANLTMLYRFAVTIAFVGCILVTANVHAEEPIEQFLSALQAKGYFDVAIDYIDRMADSTLAPNSFKQEVGYRRGMVLVNSARATRNSATRRANLDRAQKELEQFINQHPDHPSAAMARVQMGNILVERARELVQQADQEQENRDALYQKASGVFSQAYDALKTSKEELAARYASMAQSKDPAVRSLRAQYVQNYLAIARVLFEQAETLKGDEERYKAKLTEAAKAFEEVAQKYRSYSAGVYALLYEGECYQLMGDHKRALSFFKELLENQDNSTGVRRLKSQALARSIESWLTEDRDNGPDRSINAAEEWLKQSRGNEQEDPAWLDLRLQLARAYRQKSQAVSGKAASRAEGDARKIARELARRSSPVQKEAQELLVALGVGDQKEGGSPIEEPQDFEAAREVARKSLDAMKLATATVSILSGQLDRISDPARRAEVDAKLEEARAQIEVRSAESLGLFETAASMATDEQLEELNGLRYYIAYLHYARQQYHHAAVVAGFVALRHPDSIAGKECAGVALAARQRLYQESNDDARAVQAEQISKLAELIVTRWPGQPQAETALMTLLDVSIQRGDTEKAGEYLRKIPEDSPKRAKAELRIGQAFWREYLNRVADGEDGSDGELIALKEQAQQILKDGIEHADGERPDESAIRGALSLSQIYVDSGKPLEAIELLERPRLGAMALVTEESSWLEKIPGLSTEAYKVAIGAHVASAVTSADAGKEIRIAQQLLDELRNETQDQPDGKNRMMGIYISLAQDLERQMSVAGPQTRETLSKGFESFLLGAAEDARDIPVLNWVGETFYSLGSGLLRGNKTSPEAQRYFTEASRSFGEVLKLAERQPDALSKTVLTQVRVRQAMSLRQIGRYDEAVDIFSAVLRERNMVLNIQVEAAKTFQQWGTSGTPEGYVKAISGDVPDAKGKNIIWGWGRIANLVSRNEKYRSTFHQARYNVARCRYQYALTRTGTKKEELLKRAKADIVMTQKLVGLGNSIQEKRYEELLVEIQRALGEPATGLERSEA